MYKSIFLFALISFMSVSVLCQQKITWSDLTDVSFAPKFNKKYGVEFLVPTFGDQVKSYHGKRISIKGFFLDIVADGSVFLLSQNPMASCFFCGAAGPETILELSFVEIPNFKTDQIVEVTGIFELNADDVEHCNYILKEVTGKLIN